MSNFTLEEEGRRIAERYAPEQSDPTNNRKRARDGDSEGQGTSDSAAAAAAAAAASVEPAPQLPVFEGSVKSLTQRHFACRRCLRVLHERQYMMVGCEACGTGPLDRAEVLDFATPRFSHFMGIVAPEYSWVARCIAQRQRVAAPPGVRGRAAAAAARLRAIEGVYAWELAEEEEDEDPDDADADAEFDDDGGDEGRGDERDTAGQATGDNFVSEGQLEALLGDDELIGYGTSARDIESRY